MDKNKVYVLLGAGHCKSTPGKCSPDKTLKEWEYCRTIVSGIEKKLDELGIKHWNEHPEDDFVYKTKGGCKSLDSRDLVLRATRLANKYNEIKKNGYKAIYLSVHVNAAGSGGKWLNATGWSAYTTKKKNNSDQFADCLYDAAESILTPIGKKIRTDRSDGDRDFEEDFYVLVKSPCPAVLTENFFMDNKSDVEYLLSDKGKNDIIDIHVDGIMKYISKM